VANKFNDQSIEGPASSTDGNVMLFDGTGGDKAKDGGVSLATISADQLTFELVMVPDDAEYHYARLDYSIVVTGIEVEAHAAPSSALGSCSLGVYGAANLLLAGLFDLKTLVADTAQNPALTATPAHLTLAAGALINVALADTHADLVAGENVRVSIYYRRA
jgi:hypothetical protein